LKSARVHLSTNTSVLPLSSTLQILCVFVTSFNKFAFFTGTGRGGTSIYGQSFADEIHPDLKHTGAGILSMANSGRDSNGSQFFITLAPTAWLDSKHTIFGRVHAGIQVVKRLGTVEVDKNDKPVETVKIIKGKIEKF
jgi:peptidyl-prolyl cis-trans isomerase-like 1